MGNDVTLLWDEGYSYGLLIGCRLKQFGMQREDGSLGHSDVYVGHSIHTPEYISRTSIDLDDQPYAGHLFLTGARIEKSSMDLIRLDLQFGLAGPSASGEQAQKFFHEIGQFPKPGGWRHRIGHELTLNAKLGRTWILTRDSGENSYRFAVLPLSWLTVGNVLTAVGAVAALAWVHGNVAGKPIFPYFNGLAAPASEIPVTASAHRFVGYVGLESQGVTRNLFLDGPLVADGHQVAKERAILVLRFGVEAHFQHLAIGFNQTLHTRLFDEDDPHGLGKFYVSVPL